MRKKSWSQANQREQVDETRGATRRRVLGLKKAPEAMMGFLVLVKVEMW